MRWSFDRLTNYRPGEACATRDVVEDLCQLLHAKNIPAKSVQAQFVRVSALKPDGPDQKGAQMAVAELEVYE